jgi:hypothetical protein
MTDEHQSIAPLDPGRISSMESGRVEILVQRVSLLRNRSEECNRFSWRACDRRARATRFNSTTRSAWSVKSQSLEK